MHSAASSGELPCSHQNWCRPPHVPRAPGTQVYGAGVGHGGSLGYRQALSLVLMATRLHTQGYVQGREGPRRTSLLQTGSCGRRTQTEEAWLGLHQPLPQAS